MKKQEIAGIALKVLGVFAFLNAISLTQYVFLFIGPMVAAREPITVSIWLSLVVTVVPVVLLLLAGIVLVTGGEKLAAKLFPSTNTGDLLQGALSARELQALAFSVLGVYLFLAALPKFVEVGVNLFTGSAVTASDTLRSLARRTWIAVISATVQAILGVLLFLRARGLAGLWHTIQGE